MAAPIQKQRSIGEKIDFDDALDPRIQDELERLNNACEDINRLELELDEARAAFRQVLTDSTQLLNAISKKVGGSLEKARPYYDARIRLKETQVETQNAALRYDRACGQLMAAKEMVYLAEQGYFCKGQPFDPAWQEMLNHATMKVNEAETERLESEVAHRDTAAVFNEAEQLAHTLHKELKRNITKSRPYFEMKAKFNQHMTEQKSRVGELESLVSAAKRGYAATLQRLERISDEIHRQRDEARVRACMGARGTGVGAETPTGRSEESVERGGPESVGRGGPESVGRGGPESAGRGGPESVGRDGPESVGRGGPESAGRGGPESVGRGGPESVGRGRHERRWTLTDADAERATTLVGTAGDVARQRTRSVADDGVRLLASGLDAGWCVCRSAVAIERTPTDAGRRTSAATDAGRRTSGISDADWRTSVATDADRRTSGTSEAHGHTPDAAAVPCVTVAPPGGEGRAEPGPPATVERQSRLNALIMERVQRLKVEDGARGVAARDGDVDDDAFSDAGSAASGATLDDDLVDSLVATAEDEDETRAYAAFLDRLDAAEDDDDHDAPWRTCTLPSRLAHLAGYVRGGGGRERDGEEEEGVEEEAGGRERRRSTGGVAGRNGEGVGRSEAGQSEAGQSEVGQPEGQLDRTLTEGSANDATSEEARGHEVD